MRVVSVTGVGRLLDFGQPVEESSPMQLKARTLHELAEMVTGGTGSMFGSNEADPRLEPFKYRSSSDLTRFFQTCDTDHTHNGGSRIPWTEETLATLNKGLVPAPTSRQI